MSTYFLFLLAILPPIIWMVLIYWMDRHQPESLKNILIAMLLGALSIIPSLIVQLSFGWIPLFTLPGVTGGFFESFGLVAPSEEFFKFLVIYLFIRKKPFFDEINDGIVYFGAGAIGFALLENVMYVFNNGFGVGFLRAFTSIPLHAFCGALVGYHVGLARFTNRSKPGWLIFRGVVFAILTHALYNTLASSGNWLILWFVLLVLTVYIAIVSLLRRGRKLSLDTEKNPEIINVKPPISVPVVNNRPENGKKEIWKAVIGRIILVVIVCFWFLAIIGNQADATGWRDLIFGTILLTIIPFMIGVLLEISYQRRKHRKICVNHN